MLEYLWDKPSLVTEFFESLKINLKALFVFALCSLPFFFSFYNAMVRFPALLFCAEQAIFFFNDWTFSSTLGLSLKISIIFKKYWRCEKCVRGKSENKIVYAANKSRYLDFFFLTLKVVDNKHQLCFLGVVLYYLCSYFVFIANIKEYF